MLRKGKWKEATTVMALVIANLAKRAATVFCQKCHLPHIIPNMTAPTASKQFSSDGNQVKIKKEFLCLLV